MGVYYLKDHLGNVRIVFTENNGMVDIVQENHYYPFGMQMNGNWHNKQNVKNDYLYNGKELNTDLGLNWSDYGARFYDAAIGRFTGVDPISDQFAHLSTYNYASNDPILNIDLWGLQGLPMHYPTNEGGNPHDINYLSGQGEGATEIIEPIVKAVAGAIVDEIPYVGEVKAFYEGGFLEAAVGIIPFGRKIKKLTNKVFDSRKGALRQAKRDTKVPNSSEMKEIKPNTPEGKELGLDDRNKRAYVGENTEGKEVIIREDKPAKYGDADGKGDQGSHFNTSIDGKDTNVHHNYPEKE